MLILNLKKEWFDKIKSGEKTHEYRVFKDYWHNRIWKKQTLNNINYRKREDYIEFVCGYAPKEDKSKRLKAKIKSIKIINGKKTDLAINEKVYDIEFELIED